MEPQPELPTSEDLVLLERIARNLARRRRLQPEEIEDFVQSVQLRLIESGYEVFQQYAGRSSLSTYLHVVVSRLLLDWRNSLYGKWRPSAAARELGDTAIALDRLINRDGYTTDQAITVLVWPGGPSARDIRDVADRLPRRARRRFVSEDHAGVVTAVAFDDPIEATLQLRRRQEAMLALRSAVQSLHDEDRRLIALRYVQRVSVRDIAGEIGVDPKNLYRRFDRVLRSLRLSLMGAGVSGSSYAA